MPSADDLFAAAFYPIWILFGLAVVAVCIYASIRCFQLEKKAAGFGFIALVLGWLAVQPLFPFLMFVAAYCEANCDNTRISVAYMGYVGIAGLLCFSALLYVKKAK